MIKKVRDWGVGQVKMLNLKSLKIMEKLEDGEEEINWDAISLNECKGFSRGQ